MLRSQRICGPLRRRDCGQSNADFVRHKAADAGRLGHGAALGDQFGEERRRPLHRKLRRGEVARQGITRRKIKGSGVSLTMMTDSLHSHNSNHDGLRSGRHCSLLARMPKPNAKKRRVNRVKGFASRGRAKKWILLYWWFCSLPRRCRWQWFDSSMLRGRCRC